MHRDPQRCFGTQDEPLGQHQELGNDHRAAQLVYVEHTRKPRGRLPVLFIFMAVDSTEKLLSAQPDCSIDGRDWDG